MNEQRRMRKEDVARRRSVVDATTQFVNFLHRKLDRLHELWDDVGMTAEMRGERVDAVYIHLKGLLDNMDEEETNMVKEIDTKIARYQGHIAQLRSELQITDFDASSAQLEKLELIPCLESERNRLRSLLAERKEQYAKLLTEDGKLCERLGYRPAVHHDRVPTDEELEQMRELCIRRRVELDQRERDFAESQLALHTMLKRMSRPAPNAFAEQVLETPVNEIMLSESEMSALDTLLSLIRDQYVEYVEQYRFRFEELQMELQSWWDRCMVPANERRCPTILSEDEMTENSLSRVRAEILRMQNFYEERKTVMDCFEKWNGLWKEKLEHEQKQRDPGYYQNRGGNLQKELSRVKELERMLPRARDDLMSAAYDYNEVHPGSPIVIAGRAPQDLIDTIIEEYHASKELEKEEKIKKKKAQVELEMRWGTAGVPSSGSKSPGRPLTPSKSLKNLSKFGSAVGSPLKTKQMYQSTTNLHHTEKTLKRNAATPSPALGAPSPRRLAMNLRQDSMASVTDYAKFTAGIHGYPPGGEVAPDLIAHSSFAMPPPLQDTPVFHKPPLGVTPGRKTPGRITPKRRH